LNCNGLGDTNKLRRLLTKARSEVNNGGVILLQETHIKEDNLLKLYWKMSYTFSGISTRSAGVITLFDNSFECLETYTDNAGRLAISVVTKNDKKLIIVNVYVP
jgi:exonuclease III